MTSQEVVDYVMKTPNNTNPVILSQMLKDVADSGNQELNNLGITGATVGQTIVVKAVDDNGKPTQWEAVDMPDSISIGTELGVINPVADENNVLFTDENGAICIL